MTWPTVLLDSVTTRGSGHTPSQKFPEYWDGGIKWVSLADSSALDKRYINKTARTVSALGIRHSSAVLHPKGTVIVSRDAGVGKSAILGDEMAVSQHFIAWRCDPTKLHPEYLYQWLQSNKRELERMAVGSTVKTIGLSYFEKLRVPLPPIYEQAVMAKILDAWDTAIEKIERLISAKSLYLGWLREHSLARPKVAVRTKLKSVTRESRIRNGSRHGRDSIMAVTKSVGMRPMREETIAAAIDRYKLVRPMAFAYNPMRLNIGSIAMSNFDRDVLVSPDYVVFECDESKLLPGYLEHLRHTRLWGRHFEAAGSGGVRIRIYYDDLGAFAFPLPPVAQQLRVLAALDAAKAEIQTLESYLAALQQQKRGLMQKLLTGQWRIKPSSSQE